MNRLLRLLLLTLLFTFTAGAVKVFAQTTYYWTNAGADRKWSTLDNWQIPDPDNADAFITPTVLPGNNDKVVFNNDSFDATINPDMKVIIDADVTCKDFEWSVTDETPTLEGNEDLNVFGAFSVTGNIDNDYTGTVIFNGNPSAITTNTAFGAFNNLRVNSGATANLSSNITINGSLDVDGTLNAGNRNLTLGGGWTNSGTFNANTSTVNITGSSITSLPVGSLHNLTINNDAANVGLSTALSLTGNLTVSNGTLNANDRNITLAGNWATNGGAFTAGSGTVTFQGGSGTSTINTNSAFNNLAVNKDVDLSNAITVNGNLNITGELNANNRNITLGGNWTSNSGGTFTPGTGTVSFTGNPSAINTSSAFNNLRVNSGATANLSSNIQVNGTLDVDGTLNANDKIITLGGGWTNSGTFNANTSTVNITGSSITSLPVGSLHNLTINNDAANVGLSTALSLTGNLTVSNGTLNANDRNITLAGNWATNGGAFTAGSGTVTFQGGSGTSTINTNSAFNNLAVNKDVRLASDITVNGSLNIAGSLNADGKNIALTGNWTSTGTFNAAGGTVSFNGTGTSTITTNTNSAFYDLTVNTGKTVNLLSPTRVTNDLMIKGTLNDNGNQINGNINSTNTTGNKLTVDNGGTLRLANANFPAFNDRVFNTGSTVIYAGSNQTIGGGNYSTLTLSGGGTKTLGGDINVSGNVNIPSGNTLASNNFNIAIQGNWTSTGTFISKSGTNPNVNPTVTFNGTSNQKISTTPTTGNEFFKVVISNAAGVTLDSDVTIGENLGSNNSPSNNGNITFDKGIITRPAGSSNLLIINNNTTATGAIQSAERTSYVRGAIKKKGEEAFEFPVGNEPTTTQSNSYYRPLRTEANNNVETEYIVQYYNTPAAQTISPAVSTTIDDLNRNRDINKVRSSTNGQLQGLSGAVSRYEYWTLDNFLDVSGSRNTKVSIPFAVGSGGPSNYLGDLSKLVLAGWTRENYWENRGGANQKNDPNQINQDGQSGRIFGSEALSARMNVFTIGTIGNALPIELLYFRAEAKEQGVELAWATATETNNDYFTVEKSADGQSFTQLLEVKGAGNSNELKHYQATDAYPYTGVSYYRLKQTDLDGKYSYSKIEAVHSSQSGTLLQAYQSSKGQLQVTYQLAAEQAGVLSVYDSRGRLVWSKTVAASTRGEQVPLGSARGVYLVTLQSASGTLVKKVILY